MAGEAITLGVDDDRRRDDRRGDTGTPPRLDETGTVWIAAAPAIGSAKSSMTPAKERKMYTRAGVEA